MKNAANAQVQVTDVTGRIVLNRQAYLVDNQLLSLDIDHQLRVECITSR